MAGIYDKLNQLNKQAEISASGKPKDTSTRANGKANADANVPPRKRSRPRTNPKTFPHVADEKNERIKARSSKRATARENPTLLAEMASTSDPIEARKERYSFQIYSEQKKLIARIRFLYEEKTGRKLDVSRLIREALDPYLKQLEDQLEKHDGS